jgi:hypothetical protein
VTAIRLTGDQYKTFVNAIVKSYDWDSLAEVLQFDLEKRIADIVDVPIADVPPNNGYFRRMVREIIAVAQQENWLPDFIEAIYEDRKADSDLKALYQAFQPLIRAAHVDPYEVRFLGQEWAIVDRRVARQALKHMIEPKASPTDKRVLVVDGDEASGKSYTVKLIRFLRDRLDTGEMVWIDLDNYAQAAQDKHIKPTDIGQAIVNQLGIGGMPDPQGEPESRWAVTFSDWLTGQLENTGPQYWFVIDHFNRVFLRQSAHDLVLNIATRAYVNLPMLRIVLISYKDVDALRSKVQADVEYEYIEWIKEEDLVEFFLLEYADCWEEGKLPYSESDLKESAKESAARVLREVDDTNLALRWDDMRKAVAAEARQIAEQVG